MIEPTIPYVPTVVAWSSVSYEKWKASVMGTTAIYDEIHACSVVVATIVGECRRRRRVERV